MPDTDLKDRIRKAAAVEFCRTGYHGASMRDIAEAAQCSLPMMYYYFTNKLELYEEIAVNEFFRLLDRLTAGLDLSLPPEELYLAVAMQRRNLKQYDRAVMKITFRLWYGFEGMDGLRQKIMGWERDRAANTLKVLAKHGMARRDGEMFAQIFTGFLENVVTKIVLLDEDIPEETLRAQLKYLLGKAE